MFMLARVAMGTGQLHGKVLSNVIYCYGKGSEQLKNAFSFISGH